MEEHERLGTNMSVIEIIARRSAVLHGTGLDSNYLDPVCLDPVCMDPVGLDSDYLDHVYLDPIYLDPVYLDPVLENYPELLPWGTVLFRTPSGF